MPKKEPEGAKKDTAGYLPVKAIPASPQKQTAPEPAVPVNDGTEAPEQPAPPPKKRNNVIEMPRRNR